MCWADETDQPSNNNPSETEPQLIVRRSIQYQFVQVEVDEGMIIISSRDLYHNVVLSFTNNLTGEQYEYYLGDIEGVVSYPIELPAGTYLLEVKNEQHLCKCVVEM
ncbi:MAG: hypothetical protein Q4B93_05475 [Clostridia bacterium]|nr:hypothetical protein [Clostridia bacterium]